MVRDGNKPNKKRTRTMPGSTGGGSNRALVPKSAISLPKDLRGFGAKLQEIKP